MSPRTGIVFYAFFVVSLLVVQNVYIHIFAASAVFLFVLAALPLKKAKSGLLPILLFLFFTFGGNLFFHSGRVLYGIGSMLVTDEGLRLAGVRTLRVFSMIFAAKLLTATFSVDELIHALEGILRPLERTGIPVRDFFCVTGLTLKSFPALMTYLLKEYREHMKNNERAGFRRRLRHMVSFLMPVFVKSIQSPESFFVTPDVSETKKE